MKLIKAIKIVEDIRSMSEFAIQEYNAIGFDGYSQPDEDNQIKCIEKILEMDILIDVVNAPVFGINDNGKFQAMAMKSYKISEGNFDPDFAESKSIFFYHWLRLSTMEELIRFVTYEKKVKIWKGT